MQPQIGFTAQFLREEVLHEASHPIESSLCFLTHDFRSIVSLIICLSNVHDEVTRIKNALSNENCEPLTVLKWNIEITVGVMVKPFLNRHENLLVMSVKCYKILA